MNNHITFRFDRLNKEMNNKFMFMNQNIDNKLEKLENKFTYLDRKMDKGLKLWITISVGT